MTKAASPAEKASPKTRKPGAGLSKPVTPSAQLAAVVGGTPVPRTQITKLLWDYIQAHNLQDATKRTLINADDKLLAVFGKQQVTMFEMTKLISAHLS